MHAIDAGRFEVRSGELGLRAICQGMATEVAGAMGSSGGRLECTGTADLAGRGDEVHLRGVLGRVLESSLAHAPQSSTTQVCLRTQGRFAVIDFSDEGGVACPSRAWSGSSGATNTVRGR